jgi:hypothetical protein
MFKECSSCHREWESREDFLGDPAVQLIGYQVNYVDLEAGYFLFNHDTDECGTSLAISAGSFADMHKGPLFEDIHKEDAEGCPGYCDERHCIDPCTVKCECTYVRDVLVKVRDWPKQQL